MNTHRLKNNRAFGYAAKTAALLLLLATLLPAIAPQASAQGINGPADFTMPPSQIAGTQMSTDKNGLADPSQKAPECSLSVSTWDVCISNIVYVFTAGLGSGFAFIGSYFFDLTVRLSLDSASYALDFLSSGWTAARDLANMAFILILVYIAFVIMFQAETAGTIRMLAWVIFIALIINFSFFITRVVIDTGNILAVQFYNQIDVRLLRDTATSGSAAAGTVNYVSQHLGAAADTKDLTDNIMGAIKLQTLFSTPSFKIFYQNQTGVPGWLTNLIVLSFLYIAAGAMYFILAAAFLAAGIKFLTRIVILWGAIVASPFALVCRAIPSPKAKHYYDMWQSVLVSHAFYPAVFLFIFFFINEIMKTLGANDSFIGSLFQAGIKTTGQNAGDALIVMAIHIANVGIKLGLVVALLYIGMRAADAVGVFGAQAAQNFTNWVSRAGTGAAFNTTGWALRNSIGMAGNRFANSATGSKLAQGGLLGRTLWGGANALSKRTYNPANVSAVRKGLGVLGIDTPKSPTRSYQAVYDERTKRLDEQAAKIRTNAPKEMAKQRIEVYKNIPDDKLKELKNLEATRDDAKAKYEEARRAYRASGNEADKRKMDEIKHDYDNASKAYQDKETDVQKYVDTQIEERSSKNQLLALADKKGGANAGNMWGLARTSADKDFSKKLRESLQPKEAPNLKKVLNSLPKGTSSYKEPEFANTQPERSSNQARQAAATIVAQPQQNPPQRGGGGGGGGGPQPQQGGGPTGSRGAQNPIAPLQFKPFSGGAETEPWLNVPKQFIPKGGPTMPIPPRPQTPGSSAPTKPIPPTPTPPASDPTTMNLSPEDRSRIDHFLNEIKEGRIDAPRLKAVPDNELVETLMSERKGMSKSDAEKVLSYLKEMEKQNPAQDRSHTAPLGGKTWTAPKIKEEPLTKEQEKAVEKIVDKKTESHASAETATKHAEPTAPRETREQWLSDEARRIMRSVVKGTSITPEEHPLPQEKPEADKEQH